MEPFAIPMGVALPGRPTMTLRRVLFAYIEEAKYEAVRMLRSPAFAFPFLLLPVPLYLFFGVVLPAPAIHKNPAVANYLFSSWSVYSVMGPALFGVGCGLAVDREAGLVRLKRAWPMPGGALLVARMAMSMAFAALAMATLLVAALVAGQVTLSTGQLLIMTGVMVVGALPFCAIGLFLGAHTSGAAAPAFANLIFLPMLWMSALFFPLPTFLEPWAVIWPAFHLNQVALGLAGVREFSFGSPQLSAAVLVGLTVLFGGLAIRRLERKG